MKKVANLISFLVLIILLSTQSASATCNDRKNCPLDQYPSCSENVGQCDWPNCPEPYIKDDGSYVIDCAHPPTPTLTPIPTSTPTLPPGITPLPTPSPTRAPTPTPYSGCPLCPIDFHWNMAYQECCKNNETPECKTSSSPSYEDCDIGEICVLGGGCQTPRPTPPEICGYGDFPSREHCCFNPTKTPKYYCFVGSPSNQTTTCICETGLPGIVESFCGPIKDGVQKRLCEDCIKGTGKYAGKPGIFTAIGCIPTENASAFIKWFLGRAILLAGGIAFLMMIAGALMVIVSSGNPEKVKAGSQLITSAIAGLVFIIFSLFLLRLIGIEILQIPGL